MVPEREMMPELHFIFLQGMPSAFFSRIAGELSARGCKATGINVCVGDAIFWHGPHAVNYRGRLSGWPTFLANFCDKNNVTDLVMLGDQRDYHKQAIEIAKMRGIRVAVMDFGYLRPDWLTLEKDGKNSNSRFPRTMEDIMVLAETAPEVDEVRRFTDSFWAMARGDLLYSFSNVFLWWLYPFYRRSDKRLHPIIYFPAMGMRLLFARAHARQAQQKLAALRATYARFFLLPLQLEHDFQIIAYSPFRDMEEPIRKVLASFAAHADKKAHLLIKVHPWDPGLTCWERRIAGWARACGIETRVTYIDGGTIDDALAQGSGMVTVNSTSGIRALQLGVPVKTLGQAIYDIPGMTYQGNLDTFWTQAPPPDNTLVAAYLKAMAATIQIRGTFFSEPGLTAAVHAATDRLYEGKVGIPMSAISSRHLPGERKVLLPSDALHELPSDL